MSYVFSLVVAATVLGATQASSEEVGLGVSVRWVENGVTAGTSQNSCYDTDWNTAALKEGEWEPPEMIAIIEKNREDRERKATDLGPAYGSYPLGEGLPADLHR
jgi:hypothetical protein